MMNSKWLLGTVLVVSMVGLDAFAAEKPGAYKVTGPEGKEVVADQGSGLQWQKVIETKLNWSKPVKCVTDSTMAAKTIGDYLLEKS